MRAALNWLVERTRRIPIAKRELIQCALLLVGLVLSTLPMTRHSAYVKSFTWFPSKPLLDILSNSGQITLGFCMLFMALSCCAMDVDRQAQLKYQLSQDPSLDKSFASSLISSQARKWAVRVMLVVGIYQVASGSISLVEDAFLENLVWAGMEWVLWGGWAIALGLPLLLGVWYLNHRHQAKTIRNRFSELPSSERQSVQGVLAQHGLKLNPDLMNVALNHFNERRRLAEQEASQLDQGTTQSPMAPSSRRL